MEFAEVIAARHSVRRFKATPVDRELLDRLVDMAGTAPSSKNSHSSAFMVIDDPDTLKAMSEMREHGSALLEGAAAAIVVMGDTSVTDLWVENAAISATFIQLAAVDCGLGSCWVHVAGRPRFKDDASKGMAEDYLRDLLGIKDGLRVLCVIALGYPEENNG